VEGTIDDMLACDDPWVQAYFRGKRARSIVRDGNGSTGKEVSAEDMHEK
jgi:phospholipid/cholesterol/gamma-HCH transport system ATP-binding protein